MIDELISEILNSSDAGQSTKSAGRGRSSSPAGLFDTIRSVMARIASGASVLERLLLADAIAPTLADAIAPRIMKALEPTGQVEAKPPAARSHPSERTRKTGAK
ncbi:hypothetical protein ACQP00_20210 [Dactylosporangium sp. CS-047395]|uniref:hypothetical protein n=1 Tax=Dactylosporangium sp. CS-047395 TaxID=3239936 RepID=UPI003D938931